MGANTAIGEIGIYAGDADYLLRPSFRAIATLGTPRELVELLALVLGGPRHHPLLHGFNRAELNRHFRACVDVLAACADRDVSALTGYPGERWGSWRPGAMPAQEIVAVARSLLMHGMVGVLPAAPKVNHAPPPTGSEEFDAASYVGLAVAHLGVSERDAWEMTMTSFAQISKAKFPAPKEPGSDAPTEEQHDHVMDWLAKINAQRDGVAANG